MSVKPVTGPSPLVKLAVEKEMRSRSPASGLKGRLEANAQRPAVHANPAEVQVEFVLVQAVEDPFAGAKIG